MESAALPQVLVCAGEGYAEVGERLTKAFLGARMSADFAPPSVMTSIDWNPVQGGTVAVVIWSGELERELSELVEAARAAGTLVIVTMSSGERLPGDGLDAVDLSGWDGGRDSRVQTLIAHVRSLLDRVEIPEDASTEPSEVPTDAATVPAEMPQNAATEALIRYARAVAASRARGQTKQEPPVSDLDIVLGALDWLTDPDSDPAEVRQGATATLVGLVGGPQARSQVVAALDAVIATGRGGSSMQPVSLLLRGAAIIARQVGAREILPHHVVAPALAAEPLPPEVLDIWGVTHDQLRKALSSAIREQYPDEPGEYWLRLLEPSDRAPEAEPAPPGQLDPAALAIMAWTTAVRDRRGAGDATVLDVVLGSLAWAAASLSGTSPAPDPAAQALFWTLRSDSAELEALVAAALDRTGVRPLSPPLGLPGADDLEPWSPLLTTAAAIARRTTGAELIQQRHLIAAALTSVRLPVELATVLGADNGELAMRLCEGIAGSWSSESQEVWTSVLGLDQLATRFASDFVPWGERRRAGQPSVPLPDQLDVDAYVTMLATTIVRKTTAMPLSIGLFGEWGSGKSYFMRLLRQKVDILRKGSHAGTGPYYEHVVQITFNAWNYADTNLWASLAAEFFDQLGNPDPDLDYDAARRKEIKDALARQNQVRQELVSLRTAAEKRTKTARDQYVTAVVEREQKSRRFGIELIKALADDSAVRSDLQGLAKQLGFGEQETEKTLKLAEDVRGMADDLSATRRVLAARSLVVPFVLLLIALAVTGAALLIPEGTWSKIAGTSAVTSIVAFIGSLGLVIGKSRRLVTQLRNVADRAEQARLRVLAGGTVAILAEELHRAEADESIAHARLEELDATISRLDRQLDELEPGRRLYQFIAERAASVEYRSQLGVVSSVRRDFEELVALMDDWRHTTDTASDGPRRPLDRIVLYVDDLDRCEPDQVVQVLQAVHLLLAMDLFVVVVGVDPRWLLRALRRRYRGILGAAAVAAADRSLGFAESTPQNYLEKIFQIPFVLPGMSAGGFGKLMRSLAAWDPTEATLLRADAVAAAEGSDAQTAAARAGQAGAGQVGSAESDSAGQSHQPAPVRPETHSEVAAAMAAADPLTSGTVAEIVSTPVTERELVLLSRLAPLVRTPRAATRLFNIYGILRSATDLTPGRQFLGNPHQPGDYQAVAQLLAVLSAAPHLLGPILWGLPAEGEPDNRGLCRAPTLTSWAAFVDSLEPRRQSDPVTSNNADPAGSQSAVAGSQLPLVGSQPAAAAPQWSNAVAAELAADEVENWREVVVELQALRDIVKLDEIKPYKVWGPQIARFSFLLSPFAVDSAIPD